jgi:ABC-type multidrug transport system ATPase subunit
MSVLTVSGLSKTYATGFNALKNVSLEIRRGEIFALLGPNGAGKTTLIGSICGLVKKTSGRILLFGKDLDQDPVSPRYDVGLVPQEINFDPFFSVAESLHIQLGYYGRPRDEARSRSARTCSLPQARPLLRPLPHGPPFGSRPSGLSRSRRQKQRLSRLPSNRRKPPRFRRTISHRARRPM